MHIPCMFYLWLLTFAAQAIDVAGRPLFAIVRWPMVHRMESSSSLSSLLRASLRELTDLIIET